MRIKIIGDNNCARATRHLLRLAGFAVSEFLPVEAVTHAPHSGYAITIELAPAPEPLTPTEGPEQATHVQPAAVRGEALAGDVSADTSFAGPDTEAHGVAPDAVSSHAACDALSGKLPDASSDAMSRASLGAVSSHAASGGSGTGVCDVSADASCDGASSRLSVGQASACQSLNSDGAEEMRGASRVGMASRGASRSGTDWDAGVASRGILGRFVQRGQAEPCPTEIRFDSVDGALEAAVLRHVAALSDRAVVVDRPGGVVRSERELRIVVPVMRVASAEDLKFVGAEVRGATPGMEAASDVEKFPQGEFVMDEAAAVAVEFGVMRGLLDLCGGGAGGELTGVASACGVDTNQRNGVTSRDSVGANQRGEMASRDAVSANQPDLVASRERFWRGEDCGQAEACPTGGATSSGGGRKRWWRRVADLLFFDSLFFDLIFIALLAMGGILGIAMLMAGGSLPVGTLLWGEPVWAAPQGQFATGSGVKIFDGTNTLVVDPCKAQAKLFVSINQTANAQLAAGTASKKIYVCSIHVVVAAATNVALVEGTGSVCATGTAGVSGFGGATAATGWNFSANGGIALGNGEASVGAESASADNLCLFNSGSSQVSGGVSYVVQ